MTDKIVTEIFELLLPNNTYQLCSEPPVGNWKRHGCAVNTIIVPLDNPEPSKWTVAQSCFLLALKQLVASMLLSNPNNNFAYYTLNTTRDEESAFENAYIVHLIMYVEEQ